MNDNYLNVLSLGAGKQSTYVLLNALEYKYKYKLDYAVFADTGCEPERVYSHLQYLEKYCYDKYNFKITRVQYSDLKQDVLDYLAGSRSRNPQIPLKTKSSILKRHCTSDYKIAPIRKYLQSVRNGKKIRLWIGISLDEIERAKLSDVKYITHYFPLLESRIFLNTIIKFYKQFNFPEPPKSSCKICPFHSNNYLKRLKQKYQAEFEEICDFDDKIRNYKNLKEPAFLHNSLKPLRDIDFSYSKTLFPELIEECQGLCGL